MQIHSHGKPAVGCVLLGVLILASDAGAAPGYSVTGAPDSVRVGDTFEVEIVLDLAGVESLGHSVSVSFTPGLLETSGDDIEESGIPPYMGHLNPEPGTVDNESGEIGSIEAVRFQPAISASDPFPVATIQFTAVAEGTATIMPFSAQAQDGVIGLIEDSLDMVPDVTFSGATVTVAPEGSPEAEEGRSLGSWFRCAGSESTDSGR